MSHLKAAELSTKNAKDLHELLAKERTHLKDLRFRLAGAQLKNIQELTATRRSIARILTALRASRASQTKP